MYHKETVSYLMAFVEFVVDNRGTGTYQAITIGIIGLLGIIFTILVYTMFEMLQEILANIN